MDRVNRLKRLMMIHSYLYYTLDDPIVSDVQWQSWANELASEKDINTGLWEDQFEGWDGTTGYHLKYDGWTINKALYLRRLHYEKDYNLLITSIYSR